MALEFSRVYRGCGACVRETERASGGIPTPPHPHTPAPPPTPTWHSRKTALLELEGLGLSGTWRSSTGPRGAAVAGVAAAAAAAVATAAEGAAPSAPSPAPAAAASASAERPLARAWCSVAACCGGAAGKEAGRRLSTRVAGQPPGPRPVGRRCCTSVAHRSAGHMEGQGGDDTRGVGYKNSSVVDGRQSWGNSNRRECVCSRGV